MPNYSDPSENIGTIVASLLNAKENRLAKQSVLAEKALDVQKKQREMDNNSKSISDIIREAVNTETHGQQGPVMAGDNNIADRFFRNTMANPNEVYNRLPQDRAKDFATGINNIASASPAAIAKKDPSEELLSPNEALSLGVPYGTTKKGAFGKTPKSTGETKPLSGEAAKVSSVAKTVIPEIGKLQQAFRANYSGALKGIVLGYDRNLVKLVDNIADKIGRLRSGGAINKDEENRFKRQIASAMDIPFGKEGDAISALDGLILEATEVSKGIRPKGNIPSPVVADPKTSGLTADEQAELYQLEREFGGK